MPSSTSSSSSPGRAVRLRSFLIFGLGALLALELSTRVDQWIQVGVSPLGIYSYDTALLAADEWGVRGRSNGSYEKWELNELGFRGPALRPPSNAASLRIACFGASETFGLYEGEGKEWPRQLEAALRGIGIDAEVLNTAVAGTNSLMQVVHFQKRIVPLDVDVAIVVLQYSLFAGIGPEDLPDQRARVAQAGELLRDRQAQHAGMLSPRLPNKLRDSLGPRMPALLQDLVWSAKVSVGLWRRERQFGDRFLSHQAVRPAEEAAFVEVLGDFAAVARENGIRLIVASPPRWFSERNLAVQALSFPEIDESWLRGARERFDRAAEANAERLGFEFVTLSPAVDGAEAERMADLVHLNDEGALRVAEILADRVSSEASPGAR